MVPNLYIKLYYRYVCEKKTVHTGFGTICDFRHHSVGVVLSLRTYPLADNRGYYNLIAVKTLGSLIVGNLGSEIKCAISTSHVN